MLSGVIALRYLYGPVKLDWFSYYRSFYRTNCKNKRQSTVPAHGALLVSLPQWKGTNCRALRDRTQMCMPLGGAKGQNIVRLLRTEFLKFL